MSSTDRSADTEPRPAFDCRYDPDTGDMDEECVRDYLASHMPLAA